MRKIIAGLLAVLLLIPLAGCQQEQQPEQEDPVVTAYLEAAQKYIADGDLDTAIAALEEGIQETGGNEKLTTLLEEVKSQKAQQEPSTETTESSTDTTPLVSNYPIQIDMQDLLSANLLGTTFYSAYEGGSLESWMFLYVHGASDPQTVYDALWFDAELGQMTYYGILQQQAIDAGWGDIWVELVNGETSGATAAQPTQNNGAEAFIGTWKEPGKDYGLSLTISQKDSSSLLIQVSHVNNPSATKLVYFDCVVSYDAFYEGLVRFTYSDDGWGNTGTIYLEKQDGSITCTVQDVRYIGLGSYAMWGLNEGEYLLK